MARTHLAGPAGNGVIWRPSGSEANQETIRPIPSGKPPLGRNLTPAAIMIPAAAVWLHNLSRLHRARFPPAARLKLSPPATASRGGAGVAVNCPLAAATRPQIGPLCRREMKFPPRSPKWEPFLGGKKNGELGGAAAGSRLSRSPIGDPQVVAPPPRRWRRRTAFAGNTPWPRTLFHMVLAPVTVLRV